MYSRRGKLRKWASFKDSSIYVTECSEKKKRNEVKILMKTSYLSQNEKKQNNT